MASEGIDIFGGLRPSQTALVEHVANKTKTLTVTMLVPPCINSLDEAIYDNRAIHKCESGKNTTNCSLVLVRVAFKDDVRTFK